MSYFQFNAPPLPDFVAVGEDIYEPGVKHPNRQNIGVFDLLIVTQGTIFMGEDAESWEIHAGEAIILRPDRNHFATEACQKKTHFYWLHFHPFNSWIELSDDSVPATSNLMQVSTATSESPYKSAAFNLKLFSAHLPRHIILTSPESVYDRLRLLMALEKNPRYTARWQQQILFQEMMQQLVTQHVFQETETPLKIAEKAAVYLRSNYADPISYALMRDALNFHPTYIARCMRRIFGCTPLEYLIQYRMEQSKLLLINTDLPISRVAEQVGFQNISYFTRSFSTIVGMTPSAFRKQYRV